MADYLESYGNRDRRRERVIRWLLTAVAVVATGGIILYFALRDYREERQVAAFLDRLRDKDYRGAYALWGCTESTPCPHYPIEEFMKDWGPQGAYAAAAGGAVVGKKSCEGGIIGFVRVPNQPDVLLWVDRSSDLLSFAPWRLKTVTPGFRGRLQEWMWDITRNCKPLIQP